MGYKLSPERVYELAVQFELDATPWEYGGVDDISYIKTLMYNTGVMDFADKIVKELKALDQIGKGSNTDDNKGVYGFDRAGLPDSSKGFNGYTLLSDKGKGR